MEPVTRRFEKRIAEDLHAKENEARAQRFAKRREWKPETENCLGQPLPGLGEINGQAGGSSQDDISSTPREMLAELPSADACREDFPDRGPDAMPSRTSHQRTADVPEPPLTPPLSHVASSSSGESGSQGSLRVLEQDLQQTNIKVERLRKERDSLVDQQREAHVGESARLKEQVTELKRLFSEAVDEKRRLERDVEKGISRELELQRQLENARREQRQREHEISFDKNKGPLRDKGQGWVPKTAKEGKGPLNGRSNSTVLFSDSAYRYKFTRKKVPKEDSGCQIQ
ncbi:MAG: hypothetical protein M1837_002921 [Sclerophora amabilis]|nr:MAG: hypothetical protein M1837_002921 [Sclerophora amabilis]